MNLLRFLGNFLHITKKVDALFTIIGRNHKPESLGIISREALDLNIFLFK
jgi:hypothetical protein